MCLVFFYFLFQLKNIRMGRLNDLLVDEWVGWSVVRVALDFRAWNQSTHQRGYSGRTKSIWLFATHCFSTALNLEILADATGLFVWQYKSPLSNNSLY